MRRSFTKLYCPDVALAFDSLVPDEKPTIIQEMKTSHSVDSQRPNRVSANTGRTRVTASAGTQCVAFIGALLTVALGFMSGPSGYAQNKETMS